MVTLPPEQSGLIDLEVTVSTFTRRSVQAGSGPEILDLSQVGRDQLGSRATR